MVLGSPSSFLVVSTCFHQFQVFHHFSMCAWLQYPRSSNISSTRCLLVLVWKSDRKFLLFNLSFYFQIICFFRIFQRVEGWFSYTWIIHGCTWFSNCRQKIHTQLQDILAGQNIRKITPILIQNYVYKKLVICFLFSQKMAGKESFR